MVLSQPSQTELEWIRLRTELEDQYPETTWEKGMRKFKQNPMVPLGTAATVAALTYGLWNFWHGRSMMSQYMMRARIVAQGATVVAALYGLSATVPKEQ